MGKAFVIAIAISASSFINTAAAGDREFSKIDLVTSPEEIHAEEISWSKDRKLMWSDFRGTIPKDVEEQTAAATYCGIGFEAKVPSEKEPIKINVYNTFYLYNSWAKPEDRNEDVLAHEQGHFDLCELYTRKLRERLNKVKLNAKAMKPILKTIYENLQEEYRARQEEYELETEHGVKITEQRRWQKILEKELTETDQWSMSS